MYPSHTFSVSQNPLSFTSTFPRKVSVGSSFQTGLSHTLFISLHLHLLLQIASGSTLKHTQESAVKYIQVVSVWANNLLSPAAPCRRTNTICFIKLNMSREEIKDIWSPDSPLGIFNDNSAHKWSVNVWVHMCLCLLTLSTHKIMNNLFV